MLTFKDHQGQTTTLPVERRLQAEIYEICISCRSSIYEQDFESDENAEHSEHTAIVCNVCRGDYIHVRCLNEQDES